MPESILTEPYLQSAEMLAYPPRVVALAAGAWTVIAPPEPQRMTLTVVPSDWTSGLLVSPLAYGAPVLFASDSRSMPTHVHAAVYPLLIGGSWWGYSSVNQDVSVVETVRRGG